MSFFSTGAGLGAGTLVAWLGAGWYPWLLAAPVSSLVFMAGAGAEMGLAGWHHDAGGVERRKRG